MKEQLDAHVLQEAASSSSASHLEKSRDADWLAVQNQCKVVIGRAGDALAKLQPEPRTASFQSPSDLSHAEDINANKILLARKVPSLLVDCLPSPAFEEMVFTQAPELLERMSARHTFHNLLVTSFMAASGYGKTRTALKLGCLRAGVLYFNCCGQEEVGSIDMWQLLLRLRATCMEGAPSPGSMRNKR